jgi:hypothetical protein
MGSPIHTSYANVFSLTAFVLDLDTGMWGAISCHHGLGPSESVVYLGDKRSKDLRSGANAPAGTTLHGL